VTPQALNARGEQIFYHVDNEQDRKWAWRLERAVEHYRAVRERDLDKLSEVHARELSQWQLSVADAGLLFTMDGATAFSCASQNEARFPPLSIQICDANSLIIPIRCVERREAVVERLILLLRAQERIGIEGEINNHFS
jgi:hypothetical protein